jgi:hypothetical protein
MVVGESSAGLESRGFPSVGLVPQADQAAPNAVSFHIFADGLNRGSPVQKANHRERFYTWVFPTFVLTMGGSFAHQYLVEGD